MKYLVFVVIILNLIACNSESDFDSGKVLVYKGELNSKIPVLLYVTKKKDIIIGEVKYLKAARTGIKLIGMQYKDKTELTEYLNDGTISGIWRGEINNTSFKGIWNADGNKEYSFDLNRIESSFGNLDTSLIADNFTGQYKYRNGTDGYQGSILIEKHTDHYSLICANVTSAPDRNMADFTIDTLKIVDSESICDLNNDKLCVFKVKFYKDFITIKSIDDKRNCGFGLNAYVDGVYIKTKE